MIRKVTEMSHRFGTESERQDKDKYCFQTGFVDPGRPMALVKAMSVAALYAVQMVGILNYEEVDIGWPSIT